MLMWTNIPRSSIQHFFFLQQQCPRQYAYIDCESSAPLHHPPFWHQMLHHDWLNWAILLRTRKKNHKTGRKLPPTFPYRAFFSPQLSSGLRCEYFFSARLFNSVSHNSARCCPVLSMRFFFLLFHPPSTSNQKASAKEQISELVGGKIAVFCSQFSVRYTLRTPRQHSISPLKRVLRIDGKKASELMRCEEICGPDDGVIWWGGMRVTLQRFPWRGPNGRCRLLPVAP